MTTSTQNVNASREPGLTAWLTHEGARRLEEYFEQRSDCRKYLDCLTHDQGELLAPLRLKQGTYSTGAGACMFYGEAQMQDGVIEDSKDPFYLGYAYVVRIASDNGDVWQNWRYDETGQRTPRHN